MLPIPTTMRAVLLRGHGGFEQLEYRDDVPVPTPGPGEVLIRIAAAAVNNTDVNTRVGWYSKSVSAAQAGGQAAPGGAADGAWTGRPIGFPRIQGADACGRVVAVGAGVDVGRIGERVIIDPQLRSAAGTQLAGYFGSERDGAFAEFTAVPAVNACPIRSGLRDAELASFPCSYGAAENLLRRARVLAGESVLITGASGGVGSAAVQLANRRGASVIAITSRSKAAVLHSLGASRVLERDANLVAELGPESVDIVIDVVGGAHFPQLLQVLRCGGRYAVAGAIGGPLVELDLRTLYLKDLDMFGCTFFEPAVFADLVGYIERGEIKPVVSVTYPLAEIVAAQKDFLSKSRPGKIVLTI